jgi:hypothetical protein
MALQPPREHLPHQSGGAVDEVPEVVVDGVDNLAGFGLRLGASDLNLPVPEQRS